jgi:hypothetical protein
MLIPPVTVWSSGQDQVANIKRKLQLLMPGCVIFLEYATACFFASLIFRRVYRSALCCVCDLPCPPVASVDDLDEIGKLEEYVDASQCMLIFLSKGYFFR